MTNSEIQEHRKNNLVGLLSAVQREQLLANGRATLRQGWFGNPQVDRMPVAMLRCSCGAVYLLSELDPTEPAIMYGLYEDAEGTPRWIRSISMHWPTPVMSPIIGSRMYLPLFRR